MSNKSVHPFVLELLIFLFIYYPVHRIYCHCMQWNVIGIIVQLIITRYSNVIYSANHCSHGDMYTAYLFTPSIINDMCE